MTDETSAPLIPLPPLPPPGSVPTGPPTGPPLPPPAGFVAPPVAGMIAVEGVSKFFGSVVAVSDVTFAIDQGVTALLGPNGAGKSTLFRMLCGLTPPSRGRLSVLGADPRSDRAVRGSIGLVPQQDALFDHLTATEFVKIAARTHGIAPSDVDPVATWALEQVDLADVGAKRVGEFSKGMRQRVKVAAALVNDPQVLVLDEPLTGLDPVQRRRMIALFHRLGDEGRCVLVSSHVLDEVARLGSNVLVVAQGRLVARGDYRDLRALMDDRPHRIRLGSSDPRRLATALVDRGLVTALDLGGAGEGDGAGDDAGDGADGGTMVIDTLDVDVFGRRLAPIAVELGVRLREVHPLDDDLESVFRYLVEGR